ncbi:MAG: leucine dehydrogenase [Chloroflexi bacterium]|jgi:leucine dehydrogenase|nr:MAG: leucine dehydrogenase [Chloroflexota bacterium]
MNITEHMETFGHEQLSVFVDKNVGLKAYVAIHDTTLGPALGGIRIWPHETEQQAIEDVLRLARAMTYKSSAAGLYLGGGKALIVADPRTDKTEALFRAFGRFLDTLGGRCIATEDVGMTVADLLHVAQETKHVTGIPVSHGGSGDPSIMTGLGVYQGMRACAKEVLGVDSLRGVIVAVQGYGKVASHLVPHLKKDGARIIATDLFPEARARAAADGLEVLNDPEAIYDIQCDVFAPCALGGVLNGETVPRLQSRIVCGSANNQLLDINAAKALKERGILYAPDYVVNAGGVINISFEIGRPYEEAAAREKTLAIYNTMRSVIATAKDRDITTAEAADRLAEERIEQMRRIRRMHTGA